MENGGYIRVWDAKETNIFKLLNKNEIGIKEKWIIGNWNYETGINLWVYINIGNKLKYRQIIDKTTQKPKQP